jgi:hypothetical protein
MNKAKRQENVIDIEQRVNKVMTAPAPYRCQHQQRRECAGSERVMRDTPSRRVVELDRSVFSRAHPHARTAAIITTHAPMIRTICGT